MAAIKYLVDLIALFISLQAAIFLRLILPIGSVVYAAPIITPKAYLLLFFIWAILTALQSRIFERIRTKKEILRIASSTLILSLAEYLIIGSQNASFSRLFLAFFIFANLLGSFASGKLSLLLQARADWLSDLGKKSWNAYNSLNKILYRYYSEIFAAGCVGLIWAEYILKMGLTLAGDAIKYLHIGLRFAATGQLSTSGNAPFYPILISLTKFITPFPADGAAIISAACVVLFFLIFALLLRRFSQNSIANIVLIFLLATSNDFLSLFLNAWNETLYMVLLAAHFYFIVLHHANPKWAYFVGAVIAAALAMITRYVGVITGGLLILYVIFLAEPQINIGRRLRKYILPLLLAFAPFVSLLLIDSRATGADLPVPGLSQIERGVVIIYRLQYNSVLDTTVNTLKAFWGIAEQPYVILAFLVLLFILIFRIKLLDQKSRELLSLNLFFFLGYLVLTIVVYILIAAYLKTRYLAPLLFYTFVVIAQTINMSFKRNVLRLNKSSVATGILLIALIALPVYTLILQSYGVENTLIDRVRDARGKPIYPFQEGFNLSPTSEGFRDFFEQISKTHNHNTIVVIEGDYNYAKMAFESDFEVAKTFLFKSNMISSPRLTGSRFVVVTDRTQRLSYYYDGQYRELLLIIPTRITISDLIPQLEQSAQDKTGPSGVFFIINEQWFDLFANDELGSQLDKLQPSTDIEPYRIFEFRPVTSQRN